jgi:hypothetical protein
MASTYKKRWLYSLLAVDLDLFPFSVPTVLFEMRLLNPGIGDFAGRLKGDVVSCEHLGPPVPLSTHLFMSTYETFRKDVPCMQFCRDTRTIRRYASAT